MALTRFALEHELRRVAASPLLARGGVALYRGLFEPGALGRLLDEAITGPARLDVVADIADTEQVRGGRPDRRIRSIAGGALQCALFASPRLAAFVSGEVKSPVRPCGAQASYTIYRGDGSHLGIHRDVLGCDVALVTCLHDDAALEGGGALDVWFDDATTPLGVVRANPDVGRTRVALGTGDSMLIHGGVLPHRVPAMRTPRTRVVSLMCFEIVTP